jgi:hypothetical protein
MVFKDLTAKITLDLRKSELGAERKVDFLKRLDEAFEKKIINHLNRMGYKPFLIFVNKNDRSLFLCSSNFNNSDSTYFGLKVFDSDMSNPRYGVLVTGRNQRQIDPMSITSSLVPYDILL